MFGLGEPTQRAETRAHSKVLPAHHRQEQSQAVHSNGALLRGGPSLSHRKAKTEEVCS